MEVDRRLVVAGTGAYDHEDGLPLVHEELKAAIRLFGGLGYRLDERIEEVTTAELRSRLADWASRCDHTGEAVVVYCTGHGVQGPDRHYLLCRDSHGQRLNSTALAAEDLTRLVLDAGAGRVLLVVDTCYAGGAGADAARIAGTLHRSLRDGAGRAGGLTDFSVIAVARAGEPAAPMVFAGALETALARLSLSHKQQYLSVEQVVRTVNDIYRSAGMHQTAHAHVVTEGYAFFSFENSGYRPEARYDDCDLAELTVRLSPEGRRRRAELENHFVPRGRGFEDGGAGGRASYFMGRTAELDRLTTWLGGGVGGWGRGVVVTGGPGVGKSALLGRLLLRAASPASATAVPTAIHARHRFLADIVAGIADAAGLDGATTVQTLLVGLASRREPLAVLVDALDEAGEAGADDAEARRIATLLLVPLARIPCVRLLVGTRRHVLDALRGELSVLDLDDRLAASRDDVARYARRLLQAPDGPGSTGPYDDPTAVAVAEEIADRAGGSFLSARIAARHLGRMPRSIDVTDPGWRAGVPVVGEAPGETFLRVLRHRLGAQRARGLPLLGALALAQGRGLPPDEVWRAAAGALGRRSYSWEDVEWIVRAAGEHLVEDLDESGRSVYRLYHQSYADALAADITPAARDRVARALYALVPRVDRVRDWTAAPAYVLRHLAEHAEGTDLLDVLALDPAYLLTVDTDALRRVLDRAPSGPAHDAARTLNHGAALLRSTADPATRAARLRLSAFQSGAEPLARAVRDHHPDLPWDTLWADVAPVPYTTLGTLTAPVGGAAVVTAHGRPVLVTAETGGPVSVWDCTDGRPLGLLPGDVGRVTGVHGCDGHPWAALRTRTHVWVWDVESRDLIGAIEHEGRAALVDCALLALDGRCVVVTLDARGEVVLHDLTRDRVLARLREGRRRRPWQAVRLAAAPTEDGGFRVATTVEWHQDELSFRRARLTVWEIGPDAERPARTWTRVLRGRRVSALAVHGATVAAATRRAWLPTRGGRSLALEMRGLRVVEWAGGRRHLPALRVCPGAPDGTGLWSLYEAGGTVFAFDERGEAAAATPVDAPVRHLLAAGRGPKGLWLVSLAPDAASAKSWTLAPGGADDAEDAVDTSMAVGTSDGRPVVASRRGARVRLLDPETGAELRADAIDTGYVTGTSGAPLMQLRPGKRALVVRWADEGGSPPVLDRRGTVDDLRPVLLGGVPHLAMVKGYGGLGEKYLVLRKPTGATVWAEGVGLVRVGPLRAVPAGGYALMAVAGALPGSGGNDQGAFDFGPEQYMLAVRSLPGDAVDHWEEVHSLDLVHDVGVWPGGPVVGYVTADGRLVVRTRFLPAGTRSRDRHPPEPVARPDSARISVFRLQTRHGRPTVLTATADGYVTLFVAAATDGQPEVLHRIPLGCAVRDLEWVDDERLAVHTATGVICLRLP
ncbi:AAA family ATPase [Streptomyces sp. NPDC059442]|uniref:AAA family ATPase n=1 Tax=Streptomyces sp. NPDC059442 TaxID=3346830 RepID=UPI00367FA36C